MKLFNHILTTTGAAVILARNVPIKLVDAPLILTGSVLPDLLDKLLDRLLKRKTSDLFHSLFLWLIFLIVSLFVDKFFSINAVETVHLWALPLGGLIHLLFDSLSNKGIPIFLKGKRIAFNVYETGDALTEDNFAYLLTVILILIGLWMWRYHS